MKDKLQFVNKNDISNVLLITLILANPFIIYLLFESLLIVLLFFVFIFVTLLLVKRYFPSSHWVYIYIVNFYSIFAICFSFEVVFRYTFTDYIIEDLYTLESGYYFNKPNLYKTLEEKEYSAVYKTNKQGYRISEYMDDGVVVDSCDWLFVGDSYTQGAQVNFEELFTSKLFSYYPNKVIINAGISGFGLPEAYEYLKDKGNNLKPKKVFLQICNFNDFMNVEEKSFSPVDYLMSYSDLARSLLYNFKYKSPGELPLGRWTEPFYNDYQDNKNYNVFFKPASDYKKKDLENFRSYLKKIKEFVSQIHAELVVFQIPTKEQVYYKYFEEVVDKFNIDVEDLDMNLPDHYLSDICKGLKIKYLNLKLGYSDFSKQVFFDYDEHLNSAGHERTAYLLANFLEKYEEKNKIEFLSGNFSGDRYPNYSMDGKYIYFQSFRHNNMELFRSDTSMNNIERITFDDIDECHPKPSSNDKLVFTEGNSEGGKTEAVLMNLTDGIKQYLTDSPLEFSAIPTFSNDNNLITFAKWTEVNSAQLSPIEIAIYNVEKKRITKTIKNGTESWRPVFSPDDKKIAFISKVDGQFDIFFYILNSNKVERITNTKFDEWDPQFSPDGNFLVYAAQIKGNWDLYEYEIPTKDVNQLTNTLGNDWDPSYSPDGRYIIYAGDYGTMQGIFRLNRTNINN